MKKFTVISKVILMALLITCFSFASVSAAGLEGTEVNLIDETSGYKAIIPNFVEIKTINVDGSDLTVLVMGRPEKDANGEYPIFEIVTTDKNADSIFSFPGIYADGQIGELDKKFEQGRLVYSPKFAIRGDLKDISKDAVFVFDFTVYNKNIEEILYVTNLNFMFVDKATAPAAPATPATPATPAAPAAPAATQAEPVKESVVTANPTNSKVMVDGNYTAFEAYEIGGSNYFKLRDLAMALNGSGKQFQVGWDSANNAINLTTNTAYTPDGKELIVSPNPTVKEAKLTQSKIYINGKEVQLTAYSIGGNNYFKLRDIGKAIDFAVTWDGDLKMIGLDPSNSYSE